MSPCRHRYSVMSSFSVPDDYVAEVEGVGATTGKVLHPARFGDALLSAIGEMLAPYGPLSILDPFAGTGRVHELRALGHRTTGVEIQPEWAALHPGTIAGNSLHLASLLAGRKFDAVVTSCCYGNRLSDHHDAKDTCKRCNGTGLEGDRACRTCGGTGISMRRSYTHDLRRMTGDWALQLDDDNAGKMHWGPRYRDFHERVWAQVPGLLVGPKLFLLNIKDHVRNRQRQPVSQWHVGTLEKLGFQVLRSEEIDTGGLRHGANRERFPELLVLMQMGPR
jgi:hypothetical protein